MTRSRRLLIVLLVASVSCVLLVQISVDGGLFVGRAYEAIPNIDGYESLVQNDKSSEMEKLPKMETSITLPKTTKPFVATTKEYDKYFEVIDNRINKGNSQEKHKATQKAQVKEITNQNLISPRDRIQELLKQRNPAHKKSPLDPMKSLNQMSIINTNNVTRIILLTYFRSGSTFIGDILQQNWKTFYHFEPLHFMTYDRRINDEKMSDAFDLFNNIFRCNFKDQKTYLEWVKKAQNQFLFFHNTFLWVACHGNSNYCYNASFVNSVCVRAPVHVMKVTRIHMRHLKLFMETNPDLNLKVVYLTRDPRAIVSSRWSLEWCKGTYCSDPGVLCNEMGEDIKIFDELKRQQPSNFIKVRYEDVALNPENETEKLLKFLNIPYSVSVKKFLKTHTVSRKNDDKNPYSTRRNTTSMVYAWRERFTYDQLLQVQSQCEGVLTKLNHSIIASPNELPYPNGPPKTTVAVDSSRVKRFHDNPLAKKYFAKTKDVDKSLNGSVKNLKSERSNKKSSIIRITVPVERRNV